MYEKSGSYNIGRSGKVLFFLERLEVIKSVGKCGMYLTSVSYNIGGS